MAQVKVFVPTYRRPTMLRRALESLRAQTFQDWICEVHNDDPGDDRPAHVASELGDQRIRLVQHEKNLGGTATFNLFFHGCREPFYAVLEDDNWWEPSFLEAMLRLAAEFPKTVFFSANMRLWREMPDGTFCDTGRFAREEQPITGEARLVNWGHAHQASGAWHSHSATLIRSAPGQDFRTPEVPISATEIFRERAFPHPLVVTPKPLANFTITQTTARTSDVAEWAEVQAALVATFAQVSKEAHQELWDSARSKTPSGAPTLIWAGLMDSSCRSLLREATLSEWLAVVRGALRRPGLVWRLLLSRQQHAEWWEYLERNTQQRASGLAR
jgi:hypothetical protein